MNTGLHGIEWTELAGLDGLARLARVSGDDFSDQPERVEARTFRRGVVWLPAALMIGLGASWMLMSGSSSKTAKSEPARLVTAAAPQPPPSPATNIPRKDSRRIRRLRPWKRQRHCPWKRSHLWKRLRSTASRFHR